MQVCKETLKGHGGGNKIRVRGKNIKYIFFAFSEQTLRFLVKLCLRTNTTIDINNLIYNITINKTE